MARHKFIDWAPRGAAHALVLKADEICRDYAGQGYSLTLRQLYYQFVSRDLIANNQQSYKRLGDVVDKARLAGLLDWAYIVDRTRNAYRTDGASVSPNSAIYDAAQAYELPHWADQPTYAEVWVEKEALAEVIERAASDVKVVYFSCRGYVSQSEMYNAGMRFRAKGRAGKDCHLLHLGDHDPSGIDMTRDITDRLRLFAGPWAPEVHRLALNMAQVEQYGPPPNPAKVTDSRFSDYQATYGDESWELDALEPTVMHDLIITAVRGYVDQGAWDAVEERQERERRLLQDASDRWDRIAELIVGGEL